MVKTKTTPCGGKSHHPRGMAVARFVGDTEAYLEGQYKDAPGEETEDSQDWPDLDKEATQGEGEASTSKSEGKTGDQPKQTEGGAQAPPKETPPAPQPTNPNQVPTRIQPMPPLRFPPRTPLRLPSKTQMRKLHLTLLIT